MERKSTVELDAAPAQLMAWALLAIVNAGYIVRRSVPSPEVRALHHAYDAGHLLLLGALGALICLLWARLGIRKRGAALLVMFGVSLPLAWFGVRDDLAGVAETLAGEQGGPWIHPILVVIAAMVMPVATVVGSLLTARAWSRVVGIVLALGIAIANGLVLANDYRGVHLVAAIAAATLLGATITCSRIPLPRRLARGVGHFPAVLVTTLTLSTISVALPPSNAVRQELATVDGAVLLPVLARFGWGASTGDATVPSEMEEWFEDRSRHAPIAPSRPSLLPDNPLVLMITVDSMKADFFANRKTLRRLPRLAQIREQSVDFALTRSPGSRTLTAFSSIFTGKYFSQLHWEGLGNNRLSIRADSSTRFTDVLQKAGVTTSIFVSYSSLGRKGLARNFTEEVIVPKREGQPYPTSTEVMPRVIERVKQHEDGALFLFAHLMDPHFPYDSAKQKGSKRDRFLAEIAACDRAIGELWDALEAARLLDRTVFIIGADHGEALGLHDTPYHTITVYEELLRVPLFIRVPGVAPRRVAAPVTLVDIGPTVLDLFGLQTPGHFMGQSLVPFLRGEEPVLTRPIAAERRGTRALIFGKWKVIVDEQRGREEVYDLSEDPGEERNLADDLGEEGATLIHRARLFFHTHALPENQ